jgi:four helix bundle protein
MSGTYSDLKAWQASMDLAVEIYACTRSFPKEELYGLSSQLRRAVVSIPSNIAEGKGRSSDKELTQFLNHARGSLFEVETQILLAERLGYLDGVQHEKLCLRTSEVGRLLNGLIKAVTVQAPFVVKSLKPGA